MKIEFNLTDSEVEMLGYVAEDTKIFKVAESIFNCFSDGEQKYSFLCAQIIKECIKAYIVDKYKKANK